MHRCFVSCFIALTLLALAPLVARADDSAAQAFISEHEARVRPLEKAAGLAWWNANTTGKDEAFAAKEQADNELDAALADKPRFERLKALKEGTIADPALRRQIDLLYLAYLRKQVDPQLLQRMTAKANEVEKAFNVYRAKGGDKELTDSQVRETLQTSKDSKELQAVWEASKGVGAKVEGDLKELVLLRNEAARRLGFDNFQTMMLTLNEQQPKQVLKLFDELDALTREPFRAAKADIDQRLASRLGISVADLRPWHYHDPFFQESPAVYETDLDDAYRNANVVELCRKYYAGLGLPIDDVLARSDLYEKPGKSPHAFCTDIDSEGDVRVLANVVPNEKWMGTMLHELGHSVYTSKNISRSVPYVLRGDAHTLCTEGYAMLMERGSKNADFLAAMGVTVSDPAAFNAAGARMQRNRLLVFSRWCQVMLRFEMGMYADPGQDLNDLWWDLVEKYQLMTRPEGRNAPDYGSKIHIVSAPCYYHNYMLGQLFASQVHHTIAREVLKAEPSGALYVGHRDVGDFMKEKIFAPGRLYPWNDLTRRITGEVLNAKAFAEDFK